MSVPGDPTIFPVGDADFYTIYNIEPTDAFWDCVPLVCTEHYRLTLSLTRPPDGPSYIFCASASSCGDQESHCTSGSSIELTWTGSCGGGDDRRAWFSVRSAGGQFDCHTYNVQVTFTAWLTGSWCPGA